MAREDDIRHMVSQWVDRALANRGADASALTTARSTTPMSTKMESIAIGADHGGFQLKEKLVPFLSQKGYSVDDCGTHSQDSVDYPDVAHAVAQRVSKGQCRWGIIIDGAGIGSSMVANKVPGVRAALCYDLSSAKNSREHNHANVLTLGAGLIGNSLALQIVETWLTTPWGGDRHARRVAMIDAIETIYRR